MGWEDPRVIVAVAAGIVSFISMVVAIYSASRSLFGAANHANFALTAKALEMLKGDDGENLLPCMGLSEETLKDNGVTRSEFVFVTTLALGRAAYYEVMSYGQPKEATFKQDTFTYHLCKQPQFRKVWNILWPMWGSDEAFVQMMNQTIREIDEMEHN